MAEAVGNGGVGDSVPGSLHAIHSIQDGPLRLLPPLHGLQQSMLNVVAAVVRLEGGDDPLVHGLGVGGDVGGQEHQR